MRQKILSFLTSEPDQHSNEEREGGSHLSYTPKPWVSACVIRCCRRDKTRNIGIRGDGKAIKAFFFSSVVFRFPIRLTLCLRIRPGFSKLGTQHQALIPAAAGTAPENLAQRMGHVLTGAQHGAPAWAHQNGPCRIPDACWNEFKTM